MPLSQLAVCFSYVVFWSSVAVPKQSEHVLRLTCATFAGFFPTGKMGKNVDKWRKNLESGEKWRKLRRMKNKSKIGRPKGKRLTKKLATEFADFFTEKRNQWNRTSPTSVYGALSETLKSGYGITNKAVTVKRDIRGICTCKIPFRIEYGEAIRKVFHCELPKSIEYFLIGRKTEPKYKIGGTSSNLTTQEYFDSFFEYINSGETKKRMKIFARWINLEARRIMFEFGPSNFFKRMEEAAKNGLLDVDYVFFLYSPASLNLPDVKKILKIYRSFSSEIRLHFLTRTDFDLKQTSETISIWNEKNRIFTHDWDFMGQVHNLTEWKSAADCERLVKTYEMIKSESILYFHKQHPL